MHDLGFYFGFFFWICIHYDGPTGVGKVVSRFEKWNYVDMDELAGLKKGAVDNEGDFINMANGHFTDYCKPLGIWVNRLRKVIFPNGGRWKKGKSEVVFSKEVL